MNKKQGTRNVEGRGISNKEQGTRNIEGKNR
jgi:hypothetical protein